MWLSDGTQEGTREVVVPDRSRGSNPTAFAESRGTLLVATTESPIDGAIWEIDSTTTNFVAKFGGTYVTSAQLGEATVVVGESHSLYEDTAHFSWIADGESELEFKLYSADYERLPPVNDASYDTIEQGNLSGLSLNALNATLREGL